MEARTLNYNDMTLHCIQNGSREIDVLEVVWKNFRYKTSAGTIISRLVTEGKYLPLVKYTRLNLTTNTYTIPYQIKLSTFGVDTEMFDLRIIPITDTEGAHSEQDLSGPALTISIGTFLNNLTSGEVEEYSKPTVDSVFAELDELVSDFREDGLVSIVDELQPIVNRLKELKGD